MWSVHVVIKFQELTLDFSIIRDHSSIQGNDLPTPQFSMLGVGGTKNLIYHYERILRQHT